MALPRSKCETDGPMIVVPPMSVQKLLIDERRNTERMNGADANRYQFVDLR